MVSYCILVTYKDAKSIQFTNECISLTFNVDSSRGSLDPLINILVLSRFSKHIFENVKQVFKVSKTALD